VAPDPGPGNKSDLLRGVGQALVRIALRTRALGCEPWGGNPARLRRIDDGGSESVTPASRFARTPSRTKLSRTRLRTTPERSRVHRFAFARLRMAVSERLRWRPIQARAISQTAFEAWGRP
jgi:hypothetical protein